MKNTFKSFVVTTFRAKSKMASNFIVLLPAILFSVAFALLFAAEFRKKPFEVKGEVKARPTHEQLKAQRKEVETDGRIELVDEPIKMEAIRSGKTKSLIKRSTILAYRQSWTIVPKDSVLHVPKHLSSRVNGKRKGKLVTWKKFLEMNRGWLQLQNVNISQARGEAAMAEESVKVYQSSGRIVVAVCHKGPISVKPLKEPEAGKLAEGSGALIKPGQSKPALK